MNPSKTSLPEEVSELKKLANKLLDKVNKLTTENTALREELRHLKKLKGQPKIRPGKRIQNPATKIKVKNLNPAQATHLPQKGNDNGQRSPEAQASQHNNLSERQVREYVKRRKISGGTRSLLGQRCRDTVASLKKTCRLHGLPFSKYLKDRVSGAGLFF